MDPLHAMIALGPVAIYFLILGGINLDSRPTVVNGMSDAAALGIAIGGFMVAGPMELFLPEMAAHYFRWGIWPLLITFYLLCVALYVLLMRPRLIIYNITPEQLRPVLAELMADLDKDARFVGESVFMPNLGVQFHLEPLAWLKNIQLKPTGTQQDYAGWREFELRLHAELRQTRGTANPYGVSLVTFALLIFLIIGNWLVFDATAITHAWHEMMRLGD
jgi:hypothetical protein